MSLWNWQKKPVIKNAGSACHNIRAALLVVLICAVSAAAVAAPVIDPSQLPVETDAPEPLEVLWKERSGEILLETVCFNYADAPDKKEGCRKLALKKFKEECARNKELYLDFYYKRYKEAMHKYCDAADDFGK